MTAAGLYPPFLPWWWTLREGPVVARSLRRGEGITLLCMSTGEGGLKEEEERGDMRIAFD